MTRGIYKVIRHPQYVALANYGIGPAHGLAAIHRADYVCVHAFRLLLAGEQRRAGVRGKIWPELPSLQITNLNVYARKVLT